jgi:predicted transcriptional regulator
MKRDATFTLRLPSDLKAELQKIADAECRSLAKQVEKVLWDFVKARGTS